MTQMMVMAASDMREGGFVVATRSRTPVALTSLAGNQFMKAYRIMTPFWARGEGEEEEKRKKRRGEREGYCRAHGGGVCFCYPAAP